MPQHLHRQVRGGAGSAYFIDSAKSCDSDSVEHDAVNATIVQHDIGNKPPNASTCTVVELMRELEAHDAGLLGGLDAQVIATVDELMRKR